MTNCLLENKVKKDINKQKDMILILLNVKELFGLSKMVFSNSVHGGRFFIWEKSSITCGNKIIVLKKYITMAIGCDTKWNTSYSFIKYSQNKKVHSNETAHLKMRKFQCCDTSFHFRTNVNVNKRIFTIVKYACFGKPFMMCRKRILPHKSPKSKTYFLIAVLTEKLSTSDGMLSSQSRRWPQRSQ